MNHYQGFESISVDEVTICTRCGEKITPGPAISAVWFRRDGCPEYDYFHLECHPKDPPTDSPFERTYALTCNRCGHSAPVKLGDMVSELSTGLRKRRVRCTGCGKRLVSKINVAKNGNVRVHIE